MASDDRAAELLHAHLAELEAGAPLTPPLTLSSTFHLPGDPAGVDQYGRNHNPTWRALEGALEVLERAPTRVFPSGMAAIAASWFATLRAGDRLLLPSDGYYNSRKLADLFLAGLGVVVEQRATEAFVDTDFDGIRCVFIEQPSNPGLRLVDLERLCEKAHAAGAIVVVDNTLLTPFGLRALDVGADVVVAADTKAPNGHSDVLLGHLSTRDSGLLERATEWRTVSGSIVGPFEAWLALRGLQTLELRFDRMCTTANALAHALEGHAAVRSVRYPGLPSHPDHALAARQLDRSGFVIGFTLASEADAEQFIDTCRYLHPATSFGGVHSSAERRARWGDAVEPGFVRLSVGIEPTDRLIDAVLEALDALC